MQEYQVVYRLCEDSNALKLSAVVPTKTASATLRWYVFTDKRNGFG